MAEHRAIASAPFDGAEHRAKRGPNGRPLCRWCGVEVPKGRESWCSQRCVDEFVIRKGDGRAATLVFKRDKGVCALCGLDTEELYRVVRGFPSAKARYTAPRSVRPVVVPKLSHEVRASLLRGLTALGFHADQRFWQADHITPVVEGGGACGLDNLRTLCVPCHKAETAKLAAKRADDRRARKDEAAGERSLFGEAKAS